MPTLFYIWHKNQTEIPTLSLSQDSENGRPYIERFLKHKYVSFDYLPGQKVVVWWDETGQVTRVCPAIGHFQGKENCVITEKIRA